MTTIVVAGALANKPLNGGEAWVRLSWLRGLQQLGFDCHFVEQISRETCVNERGSVVAFEDSINLAYFRDVVERFDLSGSATLIYDHGQQTYGLSNVELLDLAGSAALLVNISGHLTTRPLFDQFRRRIYIDIDPGFTQFWYMDGNAGAHLRGHDLFYTIGELIGTPVSSIPTGGIQWRHVRQPVLLQDWPVSSEGQHDRFTTVASWRGAYGPVHYGDKVYGIKAHEWRKFVELPRRSSATFEVALNIHPADGRDIDLLQRHGWQLVDPGLVASGPAPFQQYVQSSGAEFSVAQGIYVETQSGWFSDRTVRYLASGKPVLVQDTGFSRYLPVGEGLVVFRTLDEAVAGATSIVSDYGRHSRAARAVAEEYFDSDEVLGQFIEEVGT